MSVSELVEYGISYGECVGYCTSVLRIGASDIELRQTSDVPGEPPRLLRGVIDRALAESVAVAVAGLDTAGLRAVYGVPDAADEGAVTIRLRVAEDVTEHRFSRGMPPAELAELDALLSVILLGWIDGVPPEGVHFAESP